MVVQQFSNVFYMVYFRIKLLQLLFKRLFCSKFFCKRRIDASVYKCGRITSRTCESSYRIPSALVFFNYMKRNEKRRQRYAKPGTRHVHNLLVYDV